MFRYCVVALLCAAFSSVASGQVLQEAPWKPYFNTTLLSYYNGNFNDTLASLDIDLRNAVKIHINNQGTALWLDSICYLTLQGECHFQMARYNEALRSFTAALQIYFEQSDWLKFVSLSAEPRQAPRAPLPWGVSARPGGIGDYNQCRFQMSHERLGLVPVGEDQGLTVQTTKTTIHADHIVQCLALSIRRRAEILGSLSKYDPETKNLERIFASRPCLPGHFAGSWVDVLHGLTLSALGDDAAAEIQLGRGLLMLGVYDHHLTPVALNELGTIALRNGNALAARTHYLEASFAAYHMGDPVLLGETFRNMANAHRMVQKSQPFPPIMDASVFFRAERKTSPMTLLPILYEEVEYDITLRRIAEAETINEISGDRMRNTRNRVLFDTAHGARYHYLAATIEYSKIYGNLVNGRIPPPGLITSGDKHLETALNFLRRGTLRLYQLNKLDEFFEKGLITTRGPITERVADELYDELLRESTEADWLVQPMESFAALVSTPPRAYENWFDVAFQRGNREKAFDISEKGRQARFFANLPLAESRLMSFRLLFEGDEGIQTPEMLLQRQTLSLEFGEFNRLAENVQNIKRQLVTLPIVPKNPEHVVGQKTLLMELQKQSEIQESILRVMALSRAKVPKIFPPTMSLEQIRKELPENTAMLTYTESRGSLYGFLIDRGSLAIWRVLPEGPRDKPLHALITEFLQDLGNGSAGQQIGSKELVNTQGKWRESGARLLRRLLGNDMRPANFSELVIVPTGALWYVPFEAMSVPLGDQFRPLLTAGQAPLVIRYAPTASLGVPKDKSGRSVNAETLILCGKLVTRDTLDISLEAVHRFTQSGIKNLTVMQADDKISPIPVRASVFSSQIQQLVVLDDIPLTPPLAWSPFSHDRTKGANSVATWLTLPWGGPRLVVLPGFHTSAEDSFKRPGVQNGDDLFLSSMLLQACGARTILISRWRTGGRVSYDLTEQFLLRLSEKPAAEAWRQAIMEVGSTPIKLDEEPRVRKEPVDEPPIANHPFFWGAFMLIDRGESPP